MINQELEVACKERPRTTKPADLIASANENFNLPWAAIQRFLHEKAINLRERHVQANPGLLAKCFADEGDRWRMDNQRFVDACEVRARLKNRRSAGETGMKSPAEIEAEMADADERLRLAREEDAAERRAKK